MGRSLLSSQFLDLSLPFFTKAAMVTDSVLSGGLGDCSLASKHLFFPLQKFREIESLFAHFHLTDEQTEVQKDKIELPKVKTQVSSHKLLIVLCYQPAFCSLFF